uniref:Uncharacterized protein n=1 Tax=Arundo donax TaxID=35708 RepID=A0A0A9EG82_ARUDO
MDLSCLEIEARTILICLTAMLIKHISYYDLIQATLAPYCHSFPVSV